MIGLCVHPDRIAPCVGLQFRSALRQQSMVISHLELCKIYSRLDQPKTALTEYGKAQKVGAPS